MEEEKKQLSSPRACTIYRSHGMLFAMARYPCQTLLRIAVADKQCLRGSVRGIIPSTFGVVQHRTAANRTTGTSIAPHTPLTEARAKGYVYTSLEVFASSAHAHNKTRCTKK